jgi:hypothetical protein
MNNNLATMKIDNNLIESTTQTLNKSQLNKNIEQPTDIVSHKVGNLNTKICNNYKNKRKECEVCDRLILATLLHHGLCEMCSVKGNNKLEYFKIKMNILK